MHAKYSALINLNLKLQFFSKAIFSLHLILLDPDDNVYTPRDWEQGVRASVAEHRLLVFRAGDGWAPLCRLDP